MKPRPALLCVAVLACAAGRVFGQSALTTSFTFQGELRQSGQTVSGVYDLRFRLYDAMTAGNEVGSQLCADNVTVANGQFTVVLDFGAQFAGQQRFLEVDVRGDTGLGCANAAGFVTLSPRESLTASPNASFALNAAQFNGQTPSFYSNASNLSAGTIPSARLAGAYSSAVTLSNVGNTFAGAGTGLTGLSATNVTVGTLSDSRLSANIARLNTANAFGNFTNSFLGNVGIGTTTPNYKLTVAGDMEMGTGAGDYHHFRIGGGNSDGFVYGSYPGLGDGIHIGYNYHYDAGGAGHIANAGGGTSRISAQYGTIELATGGAGQAPQSDMVVYSDGGGSFRLPGAVGNTRLGVRTSGVLPSDPNNAELYMDDASGTTTLWLRCEGSGAGLVSCTDLYVSGYKNFLIPNPDNDEQDISYCCIEGPEAAIFLRGSAHLVGGHARIDLPATFSSIASKEGLTVQLTPQSPDSEGLASVNRSINGFDVAELRHGTGTYDFDWEIKAVRRGTRSYQVLHPWTEHAATAATHEDQWKHRMADIERRREQFRREDSELGARP